jgi:predicted transposase YdaD
MGQTMAEVLHQRGRLEGIQEGRLEGMQEGKREGQLEAKKQTLLLLLRRKFGRKLTVTVKDNVEKTTDLARLDEWLGNVLDANTLADVGIPLKK